MTGTVMAAEVEREPSPTRTQTKRLDATVRGRKDEKGERPSSLSSSHLLEHAFGTQMLLGRDEWAHVADVIRSSFLLVAKELKRHDRWLRILETNSSLHKEQPQQEQWKQMEVRMQQKESEQIDRWRALQVQMTLVSDELLLLTHQLRQMKESEVSIQKQHFVALEMEKTSKRSEQRHARVKKRLASLELQTKRVSECQNSTRTRLCSVEDTLGTLSTEMQLLKNGISSSSTAASLTMLLPESNTKESLVAQAQCKENIRRLQHALVAHDQRAIAQARKVKRRIDKMTTRNNESAMVANHMRLQGDKRGACESKPPELSREEHSSELQSEGVPVVQSDVKTQQPEPKAQSVKPSAFSSHTTLRERYARAREKQQESLNQLRYQQQQKQ